MRATIDWSYDLLSVDERQLWRQLGVFAGGFTIEAAEKICTLPDSSSDIIDLIGRLVNKSLVGRDDRPEAARFRLLEPLRQYAAEKLTEAGDADVVRDRHADWCIAVATQASDDYYGPRQVASSEQAALEIDNIRTALGWCLDHDVAKGLRLAQKIGLFWMTSGYDHEGQRWRDALLARPDEDSPDRAWALLQAGIAASDLGDYQTAPVRFQESQAVAARVGEPFVQCWALKCLGDVATEQGNYVEAQSRFDEGVALARETGNNAALVDLLIGSSHLARYQGHYGRAQEIIDQCFADEWVRRQDSMVTYQLRHSGAVARAAGDTARAKDLLEESVARCRLIVDQPSLGMALIDLGYVQGLLGNDGQSDAALREALALFRELGHRPRAAKTLFFVGLVSIRRGAHVKGVTLVAVAEATPGFFRATLDPAERVDREERLTEARRALGEVAFDEVWSRGSALTLDAAIALALVPEVAS